MSFYSDQAAQFLQMAADIQTRLTNEGSTLDDTTYANLEKQRDALQDTANSKITEDLEETLGQLKLDEPRLASCTASLVAAVKTIKKFDQIAAIVAAAVTLATAIASADPGAIITAVAGAEKAVAGVTAKPQLVTDSAVAAADGHGGGLAIAASSSSGDSENSGS